MAGEGLKVFLQLILGGLAVGSIYALIALGFVLIYKATGVINFAQGELMMLGAYFCFTLITRYHIPFIPAFLITLAFSVILATLVEFLVLRPMVGEPIFSVVMVTIGLAIFLRSLVGIFWGHEEYKFPGFVSEQSIVLGGIRIAPEHIWTIITALVFLGLFGLFFKFTRIGIGMRATSEDQDVAFLMGISVRKIFALSWIIAAIVASVAGVFFANMYLIYSSMNFIGIRAFPAAVLGGMDSVAGAVIGGLIIGVIENLAGGYLDTLLGGGIKEITAFVVLIIILMVKPYGLFGTEEIERV